jgi:two-component system, LytTR family, response regulator
MKEDKITVMIVDDDLRSQQVLEHHLLTIPGVGIMAIASGAAEAYKFILEKVPDLIFLDVEMPGKTGFDLVNDLYKLDIRPGIIFQTAFDKYAIQAIRSAAFDYLLKPIDREELLEALIRYRSSRHLVHSREQIDQLVRRPRMPGKVKLKSQKGFILVDPDEIYYCLADWNYTEIFYGENRKTTVCMTLRKVMELMPDHLFFRINRSTLVNLNYLAEVSRMDHTCTLRIDGKPVAFPINREHIAALEEHVG